jgi:hypothetical protein
MLARNVYWFVKERASYDMKMQCDDCVSFLFLLWRYLNTRKPVCQVKISRCKGVMRGVVECIVYLIQQYSRGENNIKSLILKGKMAKKTVIFYYSWFLGFQARENIRTQTSVRTSVNTDKKEDLQKIKKGCIYIFL